MDLTSLLQADFPNITQSNYRHTSNRTPDYNCIAWAAQVNDRWWEPDASHSYYWPPGVKREYTLEAYTEAYRTVGFEVCEDGILEESFEKIAIYVNPITNAPLHAARSLNDNNWTSKLGQFIDISHETPAVLEGKTYGVVARYMKRQAP